MMAMYTLFVRSDVNNGEKNTALGLETSGGRAMQGLVTPLELVVVPYLRRRRAARPANARRESVAVVGSGTS